MPNNESSDFLKQLQTAISLLLSVEDDGEQPSPDIYPRLISAIGRIIGINSKFANGYTVSEDLVSLAKSAFDKDANLSARGRIARLKAIEALVVYSVLKKKVDSKSKKNDMEDYYESMLDWSVAHRNLVSSMHEVMVVACEDDINKRETQLGKALKEIEQLKANNQGRTNSTDAANLALKRKNARTLVKKIGDAAKLALAIRNEGPKRGGLPWSEEEIKTKAKELGLDFKGEVLKAFKAGMPPDLVKQTRGARPSSPPDNSPASSEEFPDFVGSED